ncbi:MAG: hypothetical protein U5P10_16745 [Spirochaetia bacterium]|nr:hypothetical protein [Spirochaetia bacterium]
MPKKTILMCTCSFACPSMKDLNIPELAERVRMELPHDYMLMHTRLCESNGEALMEDLLKSDDVVYVTPACKVEKQVKLLRDGFEKAGVPMKQGENWRPVSIQFKTTEQAFQDIKTVLEEI